jgi:hypothetical protein
MNNSPEASCRIYAPRSSAARKRYPIPLDPVELASCKLRDHAENMTDAAYVLAVYLEGQASRSAKSKAANGGLASN